ncbi:MAG: hypothetical protein ACRDDZ_06205 [Marinifilaceae bacterium]
MAGANDGYIYGLDTFKKGSTALGFISEDGIDWGGDKATFVKVHAAQVKTGPVKKIVQKQATNVLSFKMIQLIPDNCIAVIGGTKDNKGYTPPVSFSGIEDKFDIKCDSGHTIRIYKGSLSGEIRGKINGAEILGIDCELEMLAPDDGGALYKIFDPGVDPDAVV